MLRLFVGIDVGEAARAALAELLPSLREASPSSKWVREENLHLTVVFLGSVEEARVPLYAAALDRAVRGHHPLSLRLHGGGAFGGRGRPRVLWAGLDGEVSSLERLQISVEQAMVPLGHPALDRDYHPHVTLSRARDPRGDRTLAGCVERLAALHPAPVEVSSVVLYRSHTGTGGAKYEALHAARV